VSLPLAVLGLAAAALVHAEEAKPEKPKLSDDVEKAFTAFVASSTDARRSSTSRSASASVADALSRSAGSAVSRSRTCAASSPISSTCRASSSSSARTRAVSPSARSSSRRKAIVPSSAAGSAIDRPTGA